jgi:hypothetical protein
MDSLLKALEANGISIHLSAKTRHSTSAIIGAEQVFFGIDEPTSRLPGPHKWNEPEFQPTGVLVLRLRSSYGSYSYKEWKDGKKRRLEDVVDDFVLRVQEEAEKDRLQRLEREREQKERERLRKLQEEELARIKQLDEELLKWDKANLVRVYVKAINQKLESENRRVEPGSDLARWLEWMSEYADRLDPLLSLSFVPWGEMKRKFLLFMDRCHSCSGRSFKTIHTIRYRVAKSCG